MEDIHGVSVSWVHHPSKPGSHEQRQRSTSASNVPREAKQPIYQHGDAQPSRQHRPDAPKAATSYPGSVTPPALSQPAKNTANAVPSQPTATKPAAPSSRATSRRPGLLSRNSSEKMNGGAPAKRTSWISNISNKFSSSSTSSADKSAGASGVQQPVGVAGSSPYGPSNPSSSVSKSSLVSETLEDVDVPVSSKSKEPSFFSNLTRKWSSGAPATGAIPKVQGKGGLCERRVLNVDANRERCLIPELDVGRLRKVSFCVDVEIAGGPRYNDDDEDEGDKKKKFMDAKAKERAEGDAFRRPEAILEDDNEGDAVKADNRRRAIFLPEGLDMEKVKMDQEAADDGDNAADDGGNGDANADRKKEKKKRSEEERKERKEKRRRRAEENGSIPVELSLDDPIDVTGTSPTQASAPDKSTIRLVGGGAPAAATARVGKPTTDPVRIYRRCCQLRETPILKRITEQLMSPTCCVPTEPGVVYCLDLTGSRLQLADMVTLGDWLAVVPVKKLLLEDADVPDEGLRCILAGLLAAKRPEPTRRASNVPRHREGISPRAYQERSGVVEKLVLRNNPRISRHGWKYIGLFLYMCRSIRAIDLSMIKFPRSLPPDAVSAQTKSPNNPAKSSGNEIDAADAFYKSLSERLGRDRLEEFIVSECGFSAAQIRKIVDCAIMSGINKLGLAGNNIDDEGLEHVLRYIRSGVCGGLDLGGNDLRGKLGLIAEALAVKTSKPCWGLSLAGCNLDTSSIKALFPVLATLPDFRFIDLSHNRDLCSHSSDTISLLRRYIGKMKELKRIHLSDVGMDVKQAIALADVLPEGPKLAHVNILLNPKLTALANGKGEANQEEACALYASYMAAVKVSNTLICIDIDVPSNDNSEVVKALAKQVVAYSLRNMEHFAIAEATGSPINSKASATASLTQPHGGEQQVKEVAVPHVLMHLVGHVEGFHENHDNDDPAPDDDYIVGGIGVVKALQYVLGEKSSDLRRGSMSNTPISGARTPRPGSSAGTDQERRGKAKKMSKNLLDSARKIRARLRPALIKEATSGDDASYRRLLFLDQTLENMISRFEEEYPECRLGWSSPVQKAAPAGHRLPEQPTPLSLDTSVPSSGAADNRSDEDEDYEYNQRLRPAAHRNNSDVSLASRRSRALALEEGQLHRLGQSLRREMVDSPATALPVGSAASPWQQQETARLKALQDRLESITGNDLRDMVQHDGWTKTLAKVGANVDDLRMLQEQDPEAWQDFKESHMKARMNLEQDNRGR